MKEKKIIRDPIYKDIIINPSELEIIDNPIVQRLRNIKQTGLSYMVYPSANHSRFEHSLGTMNIAGEIFKRFINLDLEVIRLAALLHDIGHPPFSHTLEIRGYNHEEVTAEKINKMNFENYSPWEINNVLQSYGVEGKLLSGDIDADRIDYLMRDSYHTGVAYGSIDYNRLIRGLEIYQENNNKDSKETGTYNKVVISEKSTIAVESLLLARYQMYSSVYMHNTSRIAETMLKKATIYGIDNKLLKVNDLKNMDDIDLISTLRSDNKGESGKLIKMINNRDLFKSMINLKYDELTNVDKWKLINLSEEELEKLEYELEDKFGIKIFIDIPPIPKINEHNVKVLVNGKINRLDELSPLAKSLKLSYIKAWTIYIHIEPEIKRYTRNKRNSILKGIKSHIFNFIDSIEFNDKIYYLINEVGKISGKGNLQILLKEQGFKEREYIDKIKKLMFCGLVVEKSNPVRGTIRYDYTTAKIKNRKNRKNTKI